MIGTHRRGRAALSAVAGMAVAATLLTACGAQEPAQAAAPAAASTADAAATADIQKQVALYTAMRELWTDHMQWTYSTVDAFFHDQTAVQPTLDRLLQNQQDMGAAIVPFYGQEAGDQLAALLTTHIQQAVPVLTAAQAGDSAALDKALADWYANAKEIADFLSAANPENWPTSATEPMMEHHIDQTTVYATDLLKGDYAAAIKDYDEAFDHMMELSDILAKGIIAQFPDKFAA